MMRMRMMVCCSTHCSTFHLCCATGITCGGADNIREDNAPVATLPSPLHDVVVLEITPFSRANKANKARDSTLWNQLWGLVS